MVRDAVLSELDVVRDLYRTSSLWNEGDRADLLAHPEALVWADTALLEQLTRVAVREARIVGFATTLEVEGILELEDLFVDPDWMRRGVGRELVLDAVAIARDRDLPRIEVTANGHALDFYETVGFLRVGTVTTRFGPAARMHLDTT